MGARKATGVCLLVFLAAAILLGATGCGYLKNVRDDAMDCVMVGAGIVPPVVPTEEGGKAVGILPPSLGVYVEATGFCHLGGLYKVSGDVELDRRGTFVGVDYRAKAGLGPLHYVKLWQRPVAANSYKDEEDTTMDGWRKHMYEMRDPLFNRPAKVLRFRETYAEEPFLYRGWQDWEMMSVEVAIPEPFILHSGLNFRVGVDPSQMFDLVLSIFCVDLYNDAAFNFDGTPRYPSAEAE